MLWEIPIDSHKNSKTTENYNIDDVVTGVIRGEFVGNDIFNI
jgi:methyl coenzyme M reductase subunit C